MATIQYFSFDSVWYWIVFIFGWTLSVHRFLGVPYYYWTLAARGDDQLRDYVITVVPRAAQIFVDHFSIRRPVVFYGAVGFVLSIWATTGFLYDHEFLQATFVLVVPLMGTFYLRLSLARGIAQAPQEFDVLFAAVRRVRRIHIAIAFGVIFFTTIYGMIYNFAHSGVLA